ncbi:MFS transporter [Breoghania sp.]|uniref:MFS transporter n=1 Tax=Breoghania sp. TaxID=2065378 RepID=UPI00261434A4|nr:MFS transporter [Breoghania sp.]MDJ0929823.1 MFS transporter [Breoghania sp.]
MDIYFAACCSLILFFTAVVMMPRRLAEMGLSKDETGYFMAFISLIAVCTTFFMPRVKKALGDHRTLGLAFLCYAASHILYTTGALSIMIAGAVLMGCGFGFSIPLVNNMVAERSPLSHRAQNFTYLSVAIFLGQFLSSFMEFIPGNGTTAFGTAAVIAIVIAFIFGGNNLIGRLKKA